MKLNGHDLNLLDEYNQFLLNHGYCDTDIELEEATAINRFIDELNNEPKLKPHPSKVK